MTSTLLYIDPGTGSLLISAVVGFFLTLLFTLKGFFFKLSYMFSGKGDGYLPDLTGEVVFFSEGKGYWRVFRPVIEEMICRKQRVTYLSADRDDPGLAVSSDFVRTHYLGEIRQAIFHLNRLKADVCVMTTPQLDVIALKRSGNTRHYCHIIHSPTDVHAYKKFAFDYFDSVLCSSDAQIRNLRFLERERKTRVKEIFRTGCTYYDVFAPDKGESGDAVLLAPTWGDRTFFKASGKEILRHLLAGGHQVIFRPHPQSWISDAPLMGEIVREFGEHPGLTIDRAVSGEAAIRSSKLLICDISSGMVFDMAFGYKKPVVAVSFDWKDGGYEASDLPNETAAVELLRDIGAVVDARSLEGISRIVNQVADKEITREIIDKHIFNFRSSGKVAAEQILSLRKISDDSAD